jgi:hypothetical protein
MNQLEISALVIETAFSNREKELAVRSLHLSPCALAEELDCIDNTKHFPDLHHAHEAAANGADHGGDPAL